MSGSAGPFYVLHGVAKKLASFSEAALFMPLARSVLREDDVVFDKAHPKSAGQLASWKGATFGHVRAGGTRVHQGWDFFAMSGTTCFAVSGGLVAKVYQSSDYGTVLVLRLLGLRQVQGEVYAAYAHLARVLVSAGEFVKGGQAVAESGLSGNAGSYPRYPHLHFEFRTEPRPGKGLGGRLDPQTVFGNPALYRPGRFVGDAVSENIARAASIA
ncbi:peptidoglycan DD-metalloendopeptidase family protein [Falsiroseomonas sp. HC035]|uniref:peptidoglycan DD-metalloendopeptidase family protein n=1 Tax=Falsiroseomonas sp. HC035 TaxID=3390999 RepID=UPI003D30F177